MPMNGKHKLNQVAKDLKLTNQELIDFIAKNFGEIKKPSASIDTEEVNLILESFTQQNQVESFDEYFASAKKPKEEAKAEKAERPKEENVQPEKQKEEKTRQEKPKQEAPVHHEKKPNAESRKPAEHHAPAQSAQTKNAPAQKSKEHPARPKTETAKPAQPPKPTPQQQTAPAAQAPKQPQQQAAPAMQAPNPAPQQQAAPTAQAPKPAPQPPHKKPEKKQEPPKPHQHGVKAQLNIGFADSTNVEKNIRTIDTRGNYVDLDKYNEKYSNLDLEHPKGGKDNYAKKQKITQKSAQKNKQQYSAKHESEAEKLRRLELERARKQQLKVLIPDEIVVSELASRLKVNVNEVIKKLMGLGVMAGINQTVDFDTAALVAEELGAKVQKEVIVTIEERLIEDFDDKDENLVERSPVVVVMGHVDHGKTSLLDKIRNSNVTDTEAGGITQHIGAYRVSINGKEITFLDTPGHEAFTSMRARGAQVTDIAILVVAADDGIMPQTVEAINHAKAANVSIIVAINKMDKPEANPDRVKQELTEHGLVIEEWGGDVICVPVSAKTGQGIDELLENILLVAEVKELKANPNRLAKGTVIEARLDKGRGPIATVLVQNGTLHTGDIIIAGMTVGRVRVMMNDKGQSVSEAGPSVPVEITGLADVPLAGDTFNAVEDERLARELVEQRRQKAKEEQFKSYQKVTLDNLFSQIAQGEMKELPIIVKADVQGSVEAVKQSLEKLSNDEVRVKVIHGGVGAVSESDVMLANASNAIIVGFNVRPDPVAAENAQRDGVDMRFYRIIYDAIEEVSTAMKGLLAPKFREVQMGRVEVRQVYKISGVGAVAGCYVSSGKVARNCQIRVVRDGIVISEDKMASLKRFKDDVKEVAEGYECGITLEKFTDIKEGDIFEAFVMEEYRE